MIKAGSHHWMFPVSPERAADLYKVAARHELITKCSMYDTTVSTEEVKSAEMLILSGDTWDFVRVPTKSNSRITCGTSLEI